MKIPISIPFILLPFLLLTVGCGGDPPKNPESFKRNVLTTVEVGQLLDEAQKELESKGFLLREPVHSGLFGDMTSDPPTMHQPIDYLPFWRGNEDGTWSWVIALVFDESDGQRVVTDVLVQVHDRRGLPGTTPGFFERIMIWIYG